MYSTLNAQIEGKGFIARYFENVASTKLPRKWKRLIYVSSLMGLLQECQDPDMELVNKLNKVFKIVTNPQAYKLPIACKGIIWRNITNGVIDLERGKILVSQVLSSPLSRSDSVAVGIYLAESCPKWLEYGSKDLMIHDACLLLNELTAERATRH